MDGDRGGASSVRGPRRLCRALRATRGSGDEAGKNSRPAAVRWTDGRKRGSCLCTCVGTDAERVRARGGAAGAFFLPSPPRRLRSLSSRPAARDRVRAPRRPGQVYLDYTGGGLYAESQLADHLDLLARRCFGNPHSVNPTSRRQPRLLESARAAVLALLRRLARRVQRHLHSERERRPQARRRGVPVRDRRRFLLTVGQPQLGQRHPRVRAGGGRDDDLLPSTLPALRVDDARLERRPARRRIAGAPTSSPTRRSPTSPARSTPWNGSRGPGARLGRAGRRAAFAPTNRLDLGRWHPDFVPVSLLQALRVPDRGRLPDRPQAALARLRRPWFAGGTIPRVASGATGTAAPTAAGFEDGTVNYLGLPAVDGACATSSRRDRRRSTRASGCLTGWLLDELPRCATATAAGGPALRPATTDRRGATSRSTSCVPTAGS